MLAQILPFVKQNAYSQCSRARSASIYFYGIALVFIGDHGHLPQELSNFCGIAGERSSSGLFRRICG
jgi:hypothetical protein